MKLPRVEAQFLWSINHYDGPITGIALYNGKPHWVELMGPIGPPRRRAYTLHPLTRKEYVVESINHWVFRLCYGFYCDFDKDGKRRNTRPWPWWRWLHPLPYRFQEWIRRTNGQQSYNAYRDTFRKRAPIGYFVPSLKYKS